ncbi:MAG TPA: hypothetical protein VLL54_15865 [Pyrinomonadaceae bacterium]|nr:hypothetical protein [Pyrinomonadaceae bacterium]
MTKQKQWVRVTLVVGLTYFVVGFVFAQFASWSASSATRINWNRLAFLVSAVAFAIHIGYEHFRLGSTLRQTAWHTSLAVALGAFGLALAANIHELGSTSGYRPRMLIALPAWPLLTGVPAFIVALLAAAGLGLRRSRPQE